MLRIGFSKKMFTLWKIEKSTEWKTISGFNFPFEKVSFNFVRNLSTMEEEALKKAVLCGCEDVSVDFGLYGVKSSKNKPRENCPRVPSDVSLFFEVGELSGTKISDATDAMEMFWYFQQTRNVHCERRLIEDFGFEQQQGILTFKNL